MRQADILSKNLKGEKGLKSINEFQQTEKELKESVRQVIEKLSNKYPELEIYHKQKYYIKDIVKNFNKKYQKYNFENINSSSFIKPDGGFIYARKDNKEHIICISEMKFQHSKVGNAFERAAKNILVCKNILSGEKYFPYVLFIQGDVIQATNLVDRINSMNYNLPPNKIYVVEKEYDIRPFTIILRDKISIEMEYEVIKEICEESIAYIYNKDK